MPWDGSGQDARRLGAMHLLSAATNAFAEATSDYPRLLQVVARNVATAIGDTCIVLLLSKDGATLDPVAVYDADAGVMRDFEALLLGGLPTDRPSMARDVMLSGEPLCIPNLDLDELARRTTPESTALHRRIGTRGMLVVPLRVRGEAFGSLSIVRYDPSRPPFQQYDIEAALDLANHAAMAISNSRLMRDVQSELALRVAAEDALRQSELLRSAEQDALRANRFLDAIVENIPAMIFVKDAERLSFTRLNRAGEELLGIARADLMGKTDYDFFPKEEAEFFQAKDRQTLASGRLVDIAEEPIETRAGKRWLHTKKVPIVDADGTPLFLLGISHDITDGREAVETLRAAKEETEAANRELEAFSYSVAHDLRAPLRAIDGFSQALLEDYGATLDGKGQGFLRRVQGAAHDMAALIDSLLELSRLARAELVRQPVDLSALARKVGSGMREAHPDRKVELVVADGLIAQGDPRLLAIVMENLLGNAWKYTRGRAVAHVEVGQVEASDGKPPHFFVRDDGAGFDMRYADKLFGAFQRLHRRAEFEGSGIGLATVMRILRRHGGRVWAEGEVDRGATFRFEL